MNAEQQVASIVGRARTFNPNTSKTAARNAKASKWALRVYNRLLEYGDRGCIAPVMYDHFAKQYKEATGKNLTNSSVGGRFSDLYMLGMAHRNGKKRPNPNHVGVRKSMCDVWVADTAPFTPPDESELNPLARANLRHARQMRFMRERVAELRTQLKAAEIKSSVWEVKARDRRHAILQYEAKFGKIKLKPRT